MVAVRPPAISTGSSGTHSVVAIPRQVSVRPSGEFATGAPCQSMCTLEPPFTAVTRNRSSRASNATAVSRTDPDGKLRHKPGQRTHLVHRGQVAVDPERRVIVAVEAERATGSEADALGLPIRRARFAGHGASEVVAAEAGRARCRGTRLVQLQLLAAATAINLKRLLGHQDALGHTHTSDPSARLRTIRWLTVLIAHCLNDIDRLTTVDSSTGS